MKRVHYSKRMLRKQDCIKFHTCIAWQSFFFWKQIRWFLRCSAVKNKIKISSSPWWQFPVSNISCWPTFCDTFFVFFVLIPPFIYLCLQIYVLELSVWMVAGV